VRAFVIGERSGIDQLTLEHIPAPPTLGPGQIRVSMRAASLNYRDVLSIMAPARRLPKLIPCSDGAGEVTETAPDVTRVQVGARVALTFHPEWLGGPWRAASGASGRGGVTQGVMCDEVVVNQCEAVVLPPHLSFEEGATLPCAAVTAWHALCGEAPLLPGMSVLLQGGGGVSVFALQFAKLFGARVIMLSSSAERCEHLKRLGADDTVDYAAVPEWEKQVRALTGGQGVDLTIEVGGAKTIDRSLAATAMGGRLALVGLLSGMPNVTSAMFASGVSITPIRVGCRDDFESLLRAMSFHGLHPVIDRSFTFEQLPDALHYLQQGSQLGKIVIRFQ